MLVSNLKDEYPLVHCALTEIGLECCGSLNPVYRFSDGDAMVAVLLEAEMTLSELAGKQVSDVISKDDIKKARRHIPWDSRDEEEWNYNALCDALELAVVSEKAYMDALCAATFTGGKVLQSFLNNCFDGDYSYDAAGTELYVPAGFMEGTE